MGGSSTSRRLTYFSQLDEGAQGGVVVYEVEELPVRAQSDGFHLLHDLMTFGAGWRRRQCQPASPMLSPPVTDLGTAWHPPGQPASAP